MKLTLSVQALGHRTSSRRPSIRTSRSSSPVSPPSSTTFSPARSVLTLSRVKCQAGMLCYVMYAMQWYDYQLSSRYSSFISVLIQPTYDMFINVPCLTGHHRTRMAARSGAICSTDSSSTSPSCHQTTSKPLTPSARWPKPPVPHTSTLRSPIIVLLPLFMLQCTCI